MGPPASGSVRVDRLTPHNAARDADPVAADGAQERTLGPERSEAGMKPHSSMGRYIRKPCPEGDGGLGGDPGQVGA